MPSRSKFWARELLSLSETATPQEIDDAYKRRMEALSNYRFYEVKHASELQTVKKMVRDLNDAYGLLKRQG